MNCPKCVAALVAWETEKGQKVDGCARCKGVFLATAVVQAHAPRPNALEPYVSAPLIDPRESFFKCPGCDGAMTLGGMIKTDLRVDRCNACGGMWFDLGEIDRFFELIAELPPTSPNSVPGVYLPGATAGLKVRTRPDRETPPPARTAFRAYLVVLVLVATVVGFYFKNSFR